MSPILSIERVRRSFGGIVAIYDCSLELEYGKITGLIGPNGSGKTTLFNMITGIHSPETGTIRLHGEPINGLRPSLICQKGLSRTFQITRLFWDLSVLENMFIPIRRVGIGALLASDTRGEDVYRAMDLLERVGLDHLKDQPARKLSFGQQKLLELASVLMARPEIVLLDEPAGGVNPTMIRFMMELIRSLNQEGVTFFIVEHNMGFVMELCDYIFVLDRGFKIADGPPEIIQANPAVLEVYLGS
jgi:ABC-type branched-subunit amino acid transport system ATPase component